MRRSAGFTLIELIVVLVVAAMLFAVSVPSFSKLSDSRDYKSAVQKVVAAAHMAKKRAVHRNAPVDLVFNAPERSLAIIRAGETPSRDAFSALPRSLEISVVTAADVSPDEGLSAIRFYPTGGSSGGDITLMRHTGKGALIQVGWLLADVKQSPLP
ncbi:MAG: hypothetical protein CML33_06115 [Rhodobacteraceae bacterium]|nr:hypothetical protein [Paracoccaceae bacterium]|tara:strand:+ start:1347 stop:1814 length:468 start_codon:yes stop_codon:yes gene_type:complete